MVIVWPGAGTHRCRVLLCPAGGRGAAGRSRGAGLAERPGPEVSWRRAPGRVWPEPGVRLVNLQGRLPAGRLASAGVLTAIHSPPLPPCPSLAISRPPMRGACGALWPGRWGGAGWLDGSEPGGTPAPRAGRGPGMARLLRTGRPSRPSPCCSSPGALRGVSWWMALPPTPGPE